MSEDPSMFSLISPVERSPIGPANHLESTGHVAPQLRYIGKSLELLRPEQNPDGSVTRWQDLHKRINEFDSALDLHNKVRDTMLGWIANKVPAIKEKVHTFSELDDAGLIEAIGHGWFTSLESDGEEVDIKGQRREVLMTVMSHVAATIETGMYMNILQQASPKELAKLSLDPSTRDLTIQLMKTSLRADPYFIRFLAFTQQSGKPPEGKAEPESLYLSPTSNDPYSPRSLFPKEMKSLKNGFGEIANQLNPEWANIPGGRTFQEYLRTISSYYGEKDSVQASELRKSANELYKKYLDEGFPVVLTGPNDESEKAPYIDPELKISLRSPEAREDELKWKDIQEGFASSLDVIGATEQAASIRDQLIVGSVAIGAYGVNLKFDAVAQENPTIQVYLEAQARNYDYSFRDDWVKKYLKDPDAVFPGVDSEDVRRKLGYMCRTATVMHELGHWVFPEGSEEAGRFGEGKMNRTMQEIKAETLYRALIPSLIQKGKLEGTPEQWAQVLTVQSMQLMHDAGDDESDDYFLGASYSLNDLFAQNIVSFEEGKINIKDVNRYFDVMHQHADEMTGLHRDVEANETAARKFAKERCAPNEQVQSVLGYMKEHKQ